ncbi:hypothetical protein SDJN02_15233 [Cucurbita argyrosperma subsp. argyrosperma]|nr:hypothetical protein SDJN02_15233 [Cucurbita argyrosperma subsp. argyrosperma]
MGSGAGSFFKVILKNFDVLAGPCHQFVVARAPGLDVGELRPGHCLWLALFILYMRRLEPLKQSLMWTISSGLPTGSYILCSPCSSLHFPKFSNGKS